MDFSGRRVLVTGGSRGIGRAVATGFAALGASVAINYVRDKNAARETLGALAGGPHFMLPADVSDAAQVRRLVDAAVEKLGGLDVVVNNAGIRSFHPIDEVDYETWQDSWNRIIATNLIGPANVCYCAARHMMRAGGGRIVNISSRGAFRGEPDNPAYGASKAGLNAMSQSLAQRLARFHILVGVVAPGYVETDLVAERLAGPEGDEIRGQSPLGRVARPEEVAQAVLFLADDGSEFMTGAIIDVNGASYLRS
jgi:3-oxoacyl-[acyl-carrier protein] reductase